MAYTSGNLSLMGYANGHGQYYYDAGTDKLATVMASGYFNNTDDNLNLASDDEITVKAADGDEILRVDTVVAGVVTTEIGAGGSTWLATTMTDVSTLGSVWLVAPFDGFIRRIKTVLHGAVTLADAAVGVELGGVNVTGGQLTIATVGSGAGIVDTTVATALNAVSEGAAVEFDTNGGSTGTIALTVMIEFVPG